MSWKDIEKLFDESLTSVVGYTTAALAAMHHEIHFGSVTGFVGPDLSLIGQMELLAIAYLRNSKGAFLETTSLIRQAEATAALAKRLKLRIIGFYGDPETLGYDLHSRGGLMRAVLKLQVGPAGILLTDDATRIGRDGSLGNVHSLLAKQRISIIDGRTGQAMDGTAVAINAFQAAREVENLKHRSGSGKSIAVRHKKKIVKRLVYGHYRKYRGGPVRKDKLKCEVVREIHELYDSGLKVIHIVEYLNQMWTSGNKKYRPPGKAPSWKPIHLTAKKALNTGILRFRDYIGEFWHLKTENRPKNSRLARQRIRSRDEWECVKDSRLAVIDRDLFDRNLARLDRELALNSKHKPKLEKRYASNGSGRRLLSGIVFCGFCNAHKYHYSARAEGLFMQCEGTNNRTCGNWYRPDASRLEKIIVDTLEKEISDSGVLHIYQKEIEARNSAVRAEVVDSMSDIQAELKKLNSDLQNLFREMSGLTGSARESYKSRVDDVTKSMKEADAKLAIAATPVENHQLLRKVDLERCRSLLERLRDPSIYNSKEIEDHYILETVNSMVRVKIVPNLQDYGGTAQVEIDLGKFFDTQIVEPDLMRVFTVKMAPRRMGVRPEFTSQVDPEILKDLESHKLDDATWAAVTDLLKPHWSNAKFPWFYSARSLYDGMLRSLRAGAGPGTRLDTSVNYNLVTHIHYQLLKRGLWGALLKILRSHGHVWVDRLAPALLDHLNGICGVANAPWESTAVESKAPHKRSTMRSKAAA
jgi:DNA invertase Pin-like site-specific DNA recombinase